MGRKESNQKTNKHVCIFPKTAVNESLDLPTRTLELLLTADFHLHVKQHQTANHSPVGIDGKPHQFRTCITSLLSASLAVLTQGGCSVLKSNKTII